MRRRQFIKNAAGIALPAAIGGFPAILKAENARPTIRVMGTHVTLQEELRLRAEKELGINIQFYPGGSAEVLMRATTNPSSFDLYEQWSNSIRVLWNAGAIQSIDTQRIQYWNEINNLSKTGQISEGSKIGRGDAPHRILYVQKDKTLGREPSQNVSFLPYVHNTDSFGYDSRYIDVGEPYITESWGWLLNDNYSGKVAIVNEPTIGIFDLALAAQAKGLMTFNDIGNMSISEIDQLFEIAIDYKKRGHFRGVWSSVPHSVELMANNEVIIESMFSPGASALQGQGIPCIYAAPKEGYRAWHGVMCLSSQTRGEQEDAAYQFMNWWLSGYPGAFIARQGYYISNPERSKQFMSPEEWDYWYAGKPAATSLKGTDGSISVAEGSIRTGGSYEQRFSNVAVWNSVMDTYDYTLPKWKEFVLS
ncbi:PotD/PotF family extracellular solute-binding protein [Marinobacterium sp. xm-d-564]|uniref:ABC transporter substrate-binding protein n=1 Tax=Marinobacterium sp. xm-d-564 TaxID=2497742 RepID=UPI0019F3CD79|nr:extracellular solute-binding protein [Marinobacterium sp. xm-d-564]NRP59339.1 hypothetical protein [Marinobacterium sp. xm-d-564]